MKKYCKKINATTLGKTVLSVMLLFAIALAAAFSMVGYSNSSFGLPERENRRLIAVAASKDIPQPITTLSENTPQPITTLQGLKDAVSDAQNSDVILVGDIDFNVDIIRLNNQITIQKSITIKGGKENGEPSYFNGGSLRVYSQSLVPINVRLENIRFDGGVDKNGIVWADFLTEESTSEYKGSRGISFKGNVNAEITNCIFENYVSRNFYGTGDLYGRSVNGSAITSIGYGGYDTNASSDKLCLSLDNCRFYNNASQYYGGAVYLESTREVNNITFNANNCVFESNMTSHYGGAVCLINGGIDAVMTNCIFKDNTAHEEAFCDYSPHNDCNRYNDCYEWYGGGAVYLYAGDLKMTNCEIMGNLSDYGGGVYIEYGNDVRIINSVLQGNKAYECGGAIYIDGMNGAKTTVFNSLITGNEADEAGGIYWNYWAIGEGDSDWKLRLICVTHTLNTSRNLRSDDFWNSEYELIDEDGGSKHSDAIKVFGSLIIEDGLTGGDRCQNFSGQTNYTYYGNPSQAEDDGAAALIIPLSAIKSFPGGYFNNLYGDFFAGSSAVKVVVNFSIDGAILPQYQTEFVNGEILELPLPEQTGYTFNGWKYSCGTAVNPSGLRLSASTITLYGDYTAKTYNATFVIDGEAVVKQQTYGTAWDLPSMPDTKAGKINDGYFFIGWFTEDNGKGTEVSTENTFTIDKDITLYEHWGHWTKPPLPSWGIALIVIGGLAVLCACAFIVITRRRKLAPVTANAPNTSAVATLVNAESLDALAARYSLTAREKEVALLLVTGKSRTDIASEMFLSVATVKTHTHNIYSKLEVKSKFELLAKLSQ